MEQVAQQLVDKWKEIIQLINVNGYSRRVDSVDLFRMTKYYTGYPQVEFCYKATFNFPFERGEESPSDYVNDGNHMNGLKMWNEKLEQEFINIFWKDSNSILEFGSEEWWNQNLKKPKSRSNSGETKFENSKADYMTNQGYRFIIQFYPGGFLSDLRNEKIEQIGI